MTALAVKARQTITRPLSSVPLPPRALWVLALAVPVAVIGIGSAEARGLILVSLSDAYLQVSAFVAGTLLVVYGLERFFNVDTGAFLQRHAKWQVPVAAFLGALPGCGGAVVVVTQYVRGQVGFGAMLAVLTATMGDAAFLLLAQAPATGLAVFALGFIVGTLSGWAVDALHGPDFLRHETRRRSTPGAAVTAATARPPRALGRLWVALMVPGLVMGVLLAFQVDVDAPFAATVIPQPSLWLGAAGSLLAIAMWAFGPSDSLADRAAADAACDTERCRTSDDSVVDRVVGDTNFVTAWVVLAFLAYELGVYATGVDMQAAFVVWGPAVPLVGVLLGLLPGCGPQVLVTTLYLNGVVPLSAQLANAISNDGDALFPAIATSPRAALLATLYSAVPALMVGYTWWWIAE